jgi:hypothetical protein
MVLPFRCLNGPYRVQSTLPRCTGMRQTCIVFRGRRRERHWPFGDEIEVQRDFSTEECRDKFPVGADPSFSIIKAYDAAFTFRL